MKDKVMVYSLDTDGCYMWTRDKDEVIEDILHLCTEYGTDPLQSFYFSGVVSNIKASEGFLIGSLIEGVAESIKDAYGVDVYEQFDTITEDEYNKISDLVCRWIDKNVKISGCSKVTGIQKHLITHDDLIYFD